MTNFAAYTPSTWTRAGLEEAGYQGFLTFDELHTAGAPSAPKHASIYVVVRPSTTRPRFTATNPAGKHRDFSESPEVLQREWVDGAEVVYIGLATLGAKRDGTHRRLKQFRRTGASTADNHGGGVWVFQLEDAADLLVCWRAAEDPSNEFVLALEHHLIADFVARAGQGRRPFANRKD